jgi:hypothetical protein
MTFARPIALHGAGAQKGPEGPFARRLPSPDQGRASGSIPGRGAPPEGGLPMAGYHRHGSPTLRAKLRISSAHGDTPDGVSEALPWDQLRNGHTEHLRLYRFQSGR